MSRPSFAERRKAQESSPTSPDADLRAATLHRHFVVKAAAVPALLAELELDDSEVPEPSEEAIRAVLRGLGR